MKQLFLVNVNSEDVAAVNTRYSPAKVPVNVRRIFTTNCLTLEDFLNIKQIEYDHMPAIASRVVFVNLSDVRGIEGIPDGTNHVPPMDPDANAAYIESDPSVRTGVYQCWPLALPAIDNRHPNARDDDAPAPAAAAYDDGDPEQSDQEEQHEAPTNDDDDDAAMIAAALQFEQPEPEPEPEQEQPEPEPEQEQPEQEPEQEQPEPEPEQPEPQTRSPPPSPSLDASIAAALQSVGPGIPVMTPGITDGIRNNSAIEIITVITPHPAFPFVVRTISDAFELAGRYVPWTAQTRDGLVHQIESKIPALDCYELMHLVRSSSYVYELGNILCGQKYYGMSDHVKQAGSMVEKAGITPIDAMNYLCAPDELGVVPADILPDDDMALGLAMCQTKAIWDSIYHIPTPDRPPLPPQPQSVTPANPVPVPSLRPLLQPDGPPFAPGPSCRPPSPCLAHPPPLDRSPQA